MLKVNPEEVTTMRLDNPEHFREKPKPSKTLVENTHMLNTEKTNNDASQRAMLELVSGCLISTHSETFFGSSLA